MKERKTSCPCNRWQHRCVDEAPAIAYWSVPHIDRRPNISAYKPEQEASDAQ